MKIEKAKPKKGVSELPPLAKELTDKLQTCSDDELVKILQDVSVWRYGKCELYHWVDALDRFDEILEEAATRDESTEDPNPNCIFMCPKLKDPEFKQKVVAVLNFTAILIEHSYARHIYNSTEHLFALLGCPDLDVVLAVLNLFYVFSKRSNFISRLSAKKRSNLNSYLEYLGETWGGKQSGFGLAECCRDLDIKLFPPSCTSVFFKYQPESDKQEDQSLKLSETLLLENLHQGSESIPEVMWSVTATHKIPLQQQMQLLSRVRLAKNFPNFEQRLKCILARLQALSILVYSVGPAEIVDPLIYEGFVEELVEVLESKEPGLMEIKAAVLRTLTAIIHLERDPKLAAIVESTGAAAYHGFLPSLVRDSVASFTTSDSSTDFPLSFNTSLFSFLYHLATYETSGDALVTSGIMESLLQVLEWRAFEPMNITLVTRAVRVIDLVTGLDMSAFHSLGGWDKMLARLEIEVDKCRGDAPLILPSELKPVAKSEQDSQMLGASGNDSTLMDTDSSMEVGGDEGVTDVSCMPERAALIKSILNFLKKAIPEPTFAENIRNFVDSSLPKSLKHIISNAEYYGPSIYLPATEVTTVFIFQEPSQLSSLQDNGLPGVVLNSIITKQIPATREVLSSLPNILSAMCLNTRGLESFIEAEPFDHLFGVLISPEYLPAMRKKKGADQSGDTASSLGIAMDELMRHQPALRVSVIAALIRLLKILVSMGTISEEREKAKSSPHGGRKVSTVDPLSDDHMSADSDVDEDEDEEESEGGEGCEEGLEGGPSDTTLEDSPSNKSTQLLTEYLVNVIRFLDAILTNNSTKDHVTEFIKQGGLKPLVQLLALPTLPLDFPSSHGFTAISSACRGILNLAQPAELLNESIGQLSSVLGDISPLLDSPNSSSSVILEEVGPLSNVPEAIKTPQGSPLLHKLAIANSFMQLFVYIFKACNNAYVLETREACLKQFASPAGKTVLGQISKLYRALVWEGFILLAVAADEEKKKGEKQSEMMDTSTDRDPDMATSTLEGEEVVSKLSPIAESQSWELVDSLKHLAPLLTLTSRVGRSLAEFMNLLIRVAITPLIRNPHRSRYRDDPYVAPSEDALQICDEVTLLLVDSLQWKVPMPEGCDQAMRSPIKDWLFAGMTFKMYAVDFCELLLFDEHKQVYHMVLHAFDKRDGLDAYVNTFHEAMKIINGEEEGTSLYGSSVDFLEAWLKFAEKFLNTPAIISSNHSMAIPPHETTDNKRLIYHPMFNPLRFFVRTQKAVLPCLKALWDSPRLSKLPIKVIELLLATLRHFYRSEEPMGKKLDEYIAADKREDPMSQLARVRAEMEAEDRAKREKEERERQERERREREVAEPPAPPRVDPQHLQQLCDMGFARAHAEEALEACGNNLNAAMEWIFSHPSANEGTDSNVAGLSEEEAISRAIALSLENEETEEQKAEREQEEARKKEEEEERERREAEEKEKEYNLLRAMDKSILEDFSNVLLPSSIELGAAVPECVSRVCDLIVSMAKRNGDDWWYQGLDRVKNTVQHSVELMIEDVTAGKYVKPKKLMEPLACQLQLLSMIMEELPVSCANVLCEPKFLTVCVQLLEAGHSNIDTLCASTTTETSKVPPTPKWVQALLTFLDAWGRTIKVAKWWRPSRDDCIVVWQWFENSRWCSYSHDLGMILEKAYRDGERCFNVRSSGRSRYESFRNVVMFDSMLQVNTETGTIRPVIRLEVARNSRRYKKKEELEREPPVIPYEITIHNDGSAAPCNFTEEQSLACLKHCVRLLSAPIDSDTLNATLRLCLRFTREASGSSLFVKEGGPQAILALKSKSAFKGFSPLAINIFRHCIEDGDTMRRTMEYIVKSTLTTPSSIVKEVKPTGNGMKDFHYVLRRLAPVASRNEDMLSDICMNTLRVTSKVPRPESYFISQRPSPTYLKSISPKVKEPTLTQVQKSLVNLLIDHLCSDPIIGESQSIGESDETKVEDVTEARIFRGTRRTGSRGTSFRRQQMTGRFEDDDDDVTVDGEDNHPSRQASNSGAPTATSSPVEESHGLGRDSEQKTTESEQLPERPLLSKAATLKLLAETLDSYPQCATIIVESSRVIKVSAQPPKEMTVLAYIFDYLIPYSSHSNTRIQNMAKLAKSFIHCIATANYKPDIISTLVIEFKAAFLRALYLPESQAKHNRLRALTGLLGLVTDYNVLVHRGPVNPGQFARILIRKGLISDMTRAIQHLDLTSPLLPLTLNGILKPLEALTRVVNQVATTSHQIGKQFKPVASISIPEASSEPVNRAQSSRTNQLSRTGQVAASSPAIVTSSAATANATDGSNSTTTDPQPSQSTQEREDADATHESLVPLEEVEEQEQVIMEIQRDAIMDTVANLAHDIGRAHRQRDAEEMEEGDGGDSEFSSHSGSDDHSGPMLVEEADLSDEVTDSEEDEADILEDGCNSAGEEVEDEEFDESQLDSADVDSELSDTDSSHSDEEDTEVEEPEETDEEGEQSAEQTGADDSFQMPMADDVGDESYMDEDEGDSEMGGGDVLDLDYDFEDDINEEMDYFIDMPWGIQDGDVPVNDGRAAGGSSYTRSLHTRPGQHSSTELDGTANSYTGQSIPIYHPLLARTSDHSSQLAERVRTGSAVPFEAPMPIGETGPQTPDQPESAMHQLLANISVAAGNNDGLVYGVGTSGAQRIKPSTSSQEELVEEELESPVVQNALSRWDETSSVLDGPGLVHCMHELRDVIKAKWAEIYLKENPKDSSDEDTFSSSRRRTTTSSQTTTASSTSTQRTTTSTTTATNTTAAAPASTVTTQTTSSRMSSEPSTSVPTAPHPSDQATPSSPPSLQTVDQLRSSLRQVADALAQTVAAVRTTREQLTVAENNAEMEDVSESAHAGENSTTAQSDMSGAAAEASSITSTDTLMSVAVSTPASTADTTTTASSSHPVMATFDGTQESAVASLAATNREDPLYTFLSAVAGAPTPPTTDSPSTQASQALSATTESSAVSPRLPVFAQFQQPPSDSSATSTTQAPMSESTAIRTPVIQDARPLSVVDTPSQPELSLGDVQSMEQQPEREEPTVDQVPDLASQVSSFFAQNPLETQPSSSMEVSTQNLSHDLARAVESLVPSSQPTDTTQQTTPPSSSQALQSPSPSDTLAPLLLSNLQLPSSSDSAMQPSTSSVTVSSSVIHDHPHLSTSQPNTSTTTSTASAQEVASGGISSDMLTPTTGPSGLSLSVATSNTQPAAGENSSQAEGDSQSTPESNAIDPTFLAALPLSIRQEVLAQHRREQRGREPPSESQEEEAPFQSSISPEFLAALPPNIQTEVIQQERIERARQNNTNPTDPLDNSTFFRNLPSDLRRTILSDLDENSLTHLPDDLANEARRLQQERESRRRQIQAQRDAFMERMMEEAHIRAEASGAGGSGNNPGGVPHPFSHHSFEAAGLHYAIVNLNPYALIDMPTYRPDRRALAAREAAKGEPNSKQMLDPESLACVLVPLFLDHNRLHINRLHRIIKNLCQHVETRAWVLSTLLDIIRRLQVLPVGAPCPMPPALTALREHHPPATSSPRIVPSPHGSTHHWLNISINAALGSHAQVFQVVHVGKSSTINVHPLASASICNNVLDLLVFLARQFQTSFLPLELLPPSPNRLPSDAEKQKVVSKFWNILTKLDALSTAGRRGKMALRAFQYPEVMTVTTDTELFDGSIIGQLISLFSQDIFKNSVPLTDKLLRVLNHASSAIPKSGLNRRPPRFRLPNLPLSTAAAGLSQVKVEAPKDSEGITKKQTPLVSPHLIRTVVNVLISGHCSEDGLEDSTSLLTNLSKCTFDTRESILVVLLEGVKAIGQTLSSQVSALYEELLQNMESLMERRQPETEANTPDSNKATSSLAGIVLPSIAAAPERHVDHSNDLHLPSMVPLTCKGSQQSFFLRMLKVVCQLRESAQSAITAHKKAASKSSSSRGTTTAAESQDKDMDIDHSPSPPSASSQRFILQPLSLQLELEELWSMLSDCLDALGRTKDSHAVLVLQPLVEAFFLVHADSNDNLKSSKKRGVLLSRTNRLASYHTLSDAEMPPDSPAPAPMDSISPAPGTPRAESEIDVYAHLPPDIARFLRFADKHRTVLNQILRQSTVPLSEGPFSVLVHHTKVLDFDIKRRYFRQELDQTDDGMRRDDIVVHIRRDHIFEDSFRELYRRSAEELKGNLYIQFEGEEGQDVGGLLREWYLIIAREMFNPNYALFQLTPGDRVTYIPNPLSHVNPNHLNYFKFIGRVIAKAIYDNKLLDCYFTRSFYKHILGKPVHFSDIEAEDYAFYQGMVYLLKHDYNELGIDLNFTTEVQEFGKTEVKELKPDGSNIVVTEANKREYVQLACQMKMTGSIQAQIKSFLEGFYEVIPKDLISIFNEQELELLISGLPTIDIEDLKANTEYHKYTESSLQIQWFWRALRSFDQADRARFLQFVTGTSKVPLQGFAALEGMNGLQKFQIHRDDRSTDRLPCAHTCFNQLDLPPYPTFDKLYEMLVTAVRECPEGFGLA